MCYKAFKIKFDCLFGHFHGMINILTVGNATLQGWHGNIVTSFWFLL